VDKNLINDHRKRSKQKTTN